MSNEDRLKWNAKYSEKQSPIELSPNEWIIENAELILAGPILELAAGLGHSSIWLTTQGFKVDACDISAVGIAKAKVFANNFNARVNWIECDLEQYSIAVSHYQTIVCTNYYLSEQLRERIFQSLPVGGVFIYETFTEEQLSLPQNHFKNSNYLLKSNQLLEWCSALKVLKYREGIFENRAVASVIAEKQ